MMSSRSAADIGATSRAMAWSWSLVSAEVRLWKTDPTLSRSFPDVSSASMVFAKVGGASSVAMASTSLRRSANPALNAGRKCSGLIWSKGGTPKGVVHSTKNGLVSCAGCAGWARSA